MHALLPYITGLGCSICYGAATVLEQVAAKRQENIGSLHPSHFMRLIKQTPYILGIVLDLAGWGLFLITARTLPLFLTLSFVTLSLVVTAIVARVFLSVSISLQEKFAIVLIAVSIVLMGIIAQTSKAGIVNRHFVIFLEIMPVPIALLSAAMLKAKDNKFKAPMLSAIAGISFGATGLISRIINLTHLNAKVIFQVLVLSLIAYGAIGLITLASALQRDNVNRVNSILYSSELVLPSILGIIFLNDKVRSGMWPLMAVGLIGVIAGTYLCAFKTEIES